MRSPELDVVQSFTDSIQKVADANQGVQDSFVGIVKAQNDLNAARASGDPGKIAEAERGLADAYDKGTKASASRVKAYEDQARAQDALLQQGPAGVAAAQALLDDWVKRGVVPPDIAGAMQEAINKAKGVIAATPPINPKIGLDDSDFKVKVPQVEAKLKELDVKTYTPSLDVNNTPANTKTADSTSKVNAFGLLKPSAWLDANNAPANTKTADSTNRVTFFGRLNALANLGATDNASPTIHGVTASAQSFERTYTANLQVNTQAARNNIAQLRSDIASAGGIGPGGISYIPPGAPVATPHAGPTATAVPVVAGASSTVINITLPAGTTMANTVSSIRRYQRLGGDMGGLLDTVTAVR